jgi:hypothetical protein
MLCLLSIVLALGGSALCAPFAAGAPVNDAFDARQVVPGALPTSVSGSNVGATTEPGEPVHSFESPAGHSVWFSWQAEQSGWVTVGTCGSDFGTLLGVFRGASIFGLERVAAAKEGPQGASCAPAGQVVTFNAVAGSTYAIAVDGNLSPMSPPQKEGTIALQIAATPSPGNDAFASAQTVSSESLEGGTFFRVDVPGFNWLATTEPGEPALGAGASVWYSWTAPASGQAKVTAATASLSPVIGVFTGSTVGALAPVATTPFYPPEQSFTAVAGTNYRIAVAGQAEPESAVPSMGSFTFLIYLQAPANKVEVEVDTVSPNTAIVSRAVRVQRRSATMTFRASEPGAKFLCKLDGGRQRPCASPRVYAGLAFGAHAFRVRAVDASGNADPSPAVARFSIARPQRHHR